MPGDQTAGHRTTSNLTRGLGSASQFDRSVGLQNRPSSVLSLLLDEISVSALRKRQKGFGVIGKK